MNQVNLLGRLTADPSVKYSGDLAIARFTLAVSRRFKKEGQPDADFISCVAFGKTAELIEKYISKGRQLAVGGRIQTGSYEKEDGTRVYTTDVIVENMDFVGSKNDNAGGGNSDNEKPANGGASKGNGKGGSKVPEGFEPLDDNDLPF